MIISHRHRFVFAAVPKTGTHSVRQALREHLGDEDVEQVGLFVDKRFPWADLAAIRHGHLSLGQVRPHLGEDVFGGYFKFAFVRNPFDRFVSYCAFMLRGGDVFQRQPREVMRHFLFGEPPEHHILFQPQASLLVDEDGCTLLADTVGHVEDMQGSYDAICTRIGIPSRRLDRVNDSRHGDYRQYYDQALIDGVAARYAQDLELFGYGFEGPR
ncbi:sulfotransferase family 2 domain-containing protein [Caulobacter sp.]|uniref:sulfotransferase family 2 domain-containing protein n=1 Tax=Caulobacter sp. TaxID=78 RepID=UPI003BB11F44